MALAHKLQLRQGQSLVMTPQLQQAIKLLQLSNVELAEYVETEIERNPLLTRAEGESADGEAPEKVSERREEMRLDEADGASKASNDLDARSDDVYEAESASDGGGDAGTQGGPSAQLDWSKAGSGKQRSEDFDLESITGEVKTLRRSRLHARRPQRDCRSPWR